jgi:hypothetical protein
MHETLVGEWISVAADQRSSSSSRDHRRHRRRRIASLRVGATSAGGSSLVM